MSVYGVLVETKDKIKIVRVESELSPFDYAEWYIRHKPSEIGKVVFESSKDVDEIISFEAIQESVKPDALITLFGHRSAILCDGSTWMDGKTYYGYFDGVVMDWLE